MSIARVSWPKQVSLSVVYIVPNVLPGHTIASELDDVSYHMSWRTYSIIHLSLKPGCLLRLNNKGHVMFGG